MNNKSLVNLIETAPRITVFNAKGGVGKTAISLNAALSYGYGVLTNDPLSVVSRVLDDSRYRILTPKEKLPDIPADWPLIFDFGGYPNDARISKALEISQYLLIPVLPYRENIQENLNFIQEIIDREPSCGIVVIANQTVQNQFFEMQRAIRRYFPKIKVFNLKKTAAFAKMIEHGKSLRELIDMFPSHARYFKAAADQFDKIFEYIITRESR
jgi:cellulose biosynthesis protein BcsQ